MNLSDGFESWNQAFIQSISIRERERIKVGTGELVIDEGEEDEAAMKRGVEVESGEKSVKKEGRK